LPRERDHPKVGVLAPVWPSLFPVFSGGLESVLEATSISVNGLDEKAIGVRKATFRPLPVDWLSHMVIDAVRNAPYHRAKLRRSAMPAIHEVATITSKGQITLPKPIRQALGVDYGGKVAFELRGSQVIVTRANEASHEDPAIASFLALLEKDIRTGQHLCNLPDGLVQAMQAAATLPVDLDADIEGDVAL
jgi:antitoxin PrlF